MPDAVWERPQPFRPADTGVVIAAVLKALGGPAPATRVRLAAALALEPRLVWSPDRKELAEWQKAGFTLPRIGINVSARQFFQRDFTGMLERVIVESSVSPSLIELDLK